MNSAHGHNMYGDVGSQGNLLNLQVPVQTACQPRLNVATSFNQGSGGGNLESRSVLDININGEQSSKGGLFTSYRPGLRLNEGATLPDRSVQAARVVSSSANLNVRVDNVVATNSADVNGDSGLWACHAIWLQPGAEPLLPEPEFDALLKSLK